MIRPTSRPEIPEAATIKAHLSHADWWASLSPDERADIERRRKILGGLDETAALNRAGL